jgi:hypothetical protein
MSHVSYSDTAHANRNLSYMARGCGFLVPSTLLRERPQSAKDSSCPQVVGHDTRPTPPPIPARISDSPLLLAVLCPPVSAQRGGGGGGRGGGRRRGRRGEGGERGEGGLRRGQRALAGLLQDMTHPRAHDTRTHTHLRNVSFLRVISLIYESNARKIHAHAPARATRSDGPSGRSCISVFFALYIIYVSIYI